jgi:hypothetical protein
MSLAALAYARHRQERGLPGGSHQAVLKAIADGRISAPAVRREGVQWLIEPDLADRQWAERTIQRVRNDPSVSHAQVEKQTAINGIPALNVSKSVKAAIDAQRAEADLKMARIELEQLQGKLVYLSDMRQAYNAVLNTMLTRAYAAAKQVKLQIPHITLEDMQTIEKIVLDVFEQTSSDDFDDLPE